MSVDQMMLVSKILLALTIILLMLAVILYFVLDIKKAWNIIVKRKKLYHFDNRKVKHVPRTSEELGKQEPQQENKTEVLESNTTTVLEQYGETTALSETEYGGTSVLLESDMEILVDIKLIHTQVVL